MDPVTTRPERSREDGPAPTVVVVGSASRVLDPADPRGWRLGGEAAHGALLLARLGLRVGAVVGVDAEAARAHELDLLREAGADLRLAPLPAGPVFRPLDAGRAGSLRCEAPGSPLPVAALPPAWRAAPAWHLAPTADELPGGWAAIPPGPVVALAWQGILRTFEDGTPLRPATPGPRAICRRADLVGVALGELDPGADLREQVRHLRTGALCLLADGPRGGIALAVRPGAPRMRHWPAPARSAPALPDEGIFLAAVLAARVAPALAGRQPHLPAALAFATAVVAARRDPGLAGVPTLPMVREAARAAPGPRGRPPRDGPPDDGPPDDGPGGYDVGAASGPDGPS